MPAYTCPKSPAVGMSRWTTPVLRARANSSGSAKWPADARTVKLYDDLGPVGVGTTFLANALGHAAVQQVLGAPNAPTTV
jgi:hypothetical protein